MEMCHGEKRRIVVDLLWLIILSLLVSLASYLLLPVLACFFNRNLSAAALASLVPSSRKKQLVHPDGHRSGYTADPPADLRMDRLPLQRKPGLMIPFTTMIQKGVLRLQKAGYDSPNAFWIYLATQSILPLLILFSAAARNPASGTDSFAVYAMALLPAVLVNSSITRNIAARKRSFARSLYKIYRFLDLQLNAGIKMTDALRGLPDTVQDPLVHPVLVRFSALYELTLDLEMAMNLVRRSFGGPDCELLATHLRQCLQTGQAGRSLKRMEEMLFTRFFSQMQLETRQIRTRLLLTACLGMVPAIIAFLYPLLYEAAQALQSIFS